MRDLADLENTDMDRLVIFVVDPELGSIMLDISRLIEAADRGFTEGALAVKRREDFFLEFL